MKRTKFFARGVWVDKHLPQWITMIIIMIHFGLAVAVLTGGVQRFSVPSYNPLIYYSGGHTWLWGLWIGISAVLISTPFRWPNIIGLWLGMFWHMVWMTCFSIATLRYETAAATPIPIYGGMAMLCAALLTARVIDKSEE